MKKLILFILAALVFFIPVSAQILEPGILFQGDMDYGFTIAADGDKLYNMTSEMVNFDEDTHTGDVKFIIYDGNFAVVEQFTIKGIYKYIRKDNFREEHKVEKLTVLGYDFPNVVLTKGVFTNDGKWCVIVEECDNEGGGYPTAYCVYDQDSNKIGYFDPGKDKHDRLNNLYIVFDRPLGCKPYLATYYEGYDEEVGGYVHYGTIYSFTNQSGLSSPKIISRKVLAYPNPLPQGAILTIELGREVPEGTFVTFSDMRGRVIDKSHIDPGVDSFTVTPRNVSKGACVYTIYFGDGDVLSGKLLAD